MGLKRKLTAQKQVSNLKQ